MAGSIGDVARTKPRLARQKESRSLEEDSGWSEPRFAPSPPPNLEEEEDDRTPVSTTFNVQVDTKKPNKKPSSSFLPRSPVLPAVVRVPRDLYWPQLLGIRQHFIFLQFFL